MFYQVYSYLKNKKKNEEQLNYNKPTDDSYVSELLTKTFSKYYKKDSTMNDNTQQAVDSNSKRYPYASIEEYSNATGKRFRITKEQKERGLSREEAFMEFMDKMVQAPSN